MEGEGRRGRDLKEGRLNEVTQKAQDYQDCNDETTLIALLTIDTFLSYIMCSSIYVMFLCEHGEGVCDDTALLRGMEQRGGEHTASNLPWCLSDRTSDWQVSGFYLM